MINLVPWLLFYSSSLTHSGGWVGKEPGNEMGSYQYNACDAWKYHVSFLPDKILHLLVTNLHTIRVLLQCSSVHKIIVLSKPFFSVFSLFSFSLPIFYNSHYLKFFWFVFVIAAIYLSNLCYITHDNIIWDLTWFQIIKSLSFELLRG